MPTTVTKHYDENIDFNRWALAPPCLQLGKSQLFGSYRRPLIFIYETNMLANIARLAVVFYYKFLSKKRCIRHSYKSTK